MSQAALRARVKTMSEDILRGLLKSIHKSGEQAAVQVATGCSSASDTSASDMEEPHEEDEQPFLAICTVPADAADEEGENGEEDDGALAVFWVTGWLLVQSVGDILFATVRL